MFGDCFYFYFFVILLQNSLVYVLLQNTVEETSVLK